MTTTRGLQRRCSDRIACVSRGIEILDGLYTGPATFVRVIVYIEANATDSYDLDDTVGYRAPQLLRMARSTV